MNNELESGIRTKSTLKLTRQYDIDYGEKRDGGGEKSLYNYTVQL